MRRVIALAIPVAGFAWLLIELASLIPSVG